MNLIEYPDRDMMMIDLANQLAGDLNTALMSKGTASLAVPGGTTPGPAFDALCAAELDWAKVTVMATDERRVPDTSDRSNARLIRNRLLTGPAAAAQFVSFAIAESADLAPVQDAIAPHLPIDVLLLGMGADMHTASLFPGAPELAAALDDDAPALIQITPVGGLEPRLSLSGPVLRGAVSTHVLITGADKRKALETAATLHDAALAPIRTVLQQSTIHWAE